MSVCRRCDPPTDHDDLPTHAQATGHWLCICCNRSLDWTRPQVCQHCSDRAWVTLEGIRSLWPDLEEAARPTGSRHVIPGGDILVMLGPGSAGRTGLFGAPMRNGTLDDTHGYDEHTSDPPSISNELATLEADWREHRGDPAAVLQPGRHVTHAASLVSQQLHAAIVYLKAHHDWAATSHPAFDEYATTLHQLHSRMRGALGLLERPETGAPCMACSTPAERVLLEKVYGRDEQADYWLCQRCGDVKSADAYRDALRDGLSSVREAS